MLNHFLSLTILLSANAFAQSKVVPATGFKGGAALNDSFIPKTTLGAWGTQTSTFQYDIMLGGQSPLELEPQGLKRECDKDQSFTLSFQQRQNIAKLEAPFTAMQCEAAMNVKATRVLNPEVCAMMANCYKSKMSLGNGYYEEVIKANERTASEAVSLMAQTTISQLSDLEELKAYASEKYGQDFIPEECREENPLDLPQGEEAGCMSKIIDKGYEMAQKGCNLVEVGCNPDYLDFIKGKNTENGKTSLMADYIKKRAKDSTKLMLVDDAGITQSIAHIMTDPKGTPEEKAKAVIDFLSANFSNLDPVYKGYMKQSIRASGENGKDEIYEGLLKYIKTNGKKNPLEVLNELDILRQKEAGKILADKCQKSMSMPKLCKMVKEVVNGAEVQVPKKNFEQMMKRQEFSPSSLGMTRQELADNVSRCNIFSIDTTIGSSGSSVVRLSNGRNLFSNGFSGMFTIKETAMSGIHSGVGESSVLPQFILKDNGDFSKKDRLTSGVVEKLSSSKEISPNDSVLVSKFSNNLITQDSKRSDFGLRSLQTVKISEGGEVKLQTSKEEVIKSAVQENQLTNANLQPQLQAQQNLMNAKAILPNGSRTQDSLIDGPSDIVKNESMTKPKVQTPDYSQLMNKIAGLEEKLSSHKKPVVEASGSDTKVSEESDLARELRLAKASLAEMNKANIEAKFKPSADSTDATRSARSHAIVNEKSEEGEAGSAVIAASGSSNKEARASAAVAPPSGSSNSGSNSSSGGSSSGDRSPASIESSGSISHSSGSGGESSGSSSGDGFVLTRLDGISRSKASETISRMIMAESGKPFYIEEGGLVKEIIPEVVDGVILKAEDGTPVYKTIVKGKVGEFKIDSKGKKVKKEVIAKAASPADVKIQDNQKLNAPAVRYRELQQIFQTKK